MALAKVLLISGLDYYYSPYTFPNITESRNMLLTVWYDKTESDWILFVDADMEFDPTMVLAMLKSGHPLVGCLYPVKTFPIRYVGSWAEKPKVQGGFMEVEGIGFGVTLIHRSAVKQMLENGFAKRDERPHHAITDMTLKYGISSLIRAFDEIDIEGGRLSEDFSFCHRHKQGGGEVWADISYPVTHIGQHGFTGRFADVIAAQQSEQVSRESAA